VNDSRLTRKILESICLCWGTSFCFRHRFWTAVHARNKRICISYIVARSSGHLQQAEIQIWSSLTCPYSTSKEQTSLSYHFGLFFSPVTSFQMPLLENCQWSEL